MHKILTFHTRFRRNLGSRSYEKQLTNDDFKIHCVEHSFGGTLSCKNDYEKSWVTLKALFKIHVKHVLSLLLLEIPGSQICLFLSDDAER